MKGAVEVGRKIRKKNWRLCIDADTGYMCQSVWKKCNKGNRWMLNSGSCLHSRKISIHWPQPASLMKCDRLVVKLDLKTFRCCKTLPACCFHVMWPLSLLSCPSLSHTICYSYGISNAHWIDSPGPLDLDKLHMSKEWSDCPTRVSLHIDCCSPQGGSVARIMMIRVAIRFAKVICCPSAVF